jgi:hypothetical protein
MATLEVTFEGCVQDSEEFGSGPDRMVSRVYFWIRREGSAHGDFRADFHNATGYRFFRRRVEPPERYTGPMLHVEIVQPVGEDFLTGPIAIGPPSGYSGPFDHPGFARAATEYFRSLMSDAGVMQRREDGHPLHGGLRETQHVRLRNNAELSRRTVQIPVSAGASLQS